MAFMLKVMANDRFKPDWQLRCASLPAGYAERSLKIFGIKDNIPGGLK